MEFVHIIMDNKRLGEAGGAMIKDIITDAGKNGRIFSSWMPTKINAVGRILEIDLIFEEAEDVITPEFEIIEADTAPGQTAFLSGHKELIREREDEISFIGCVPIELGVSSKINKMLLIFMPLSNKA